MRFAMLPNTLSIFRIILTVPIVIAVLKEQYLLVLLLFTLAGITDALDGWIAKHYSLQSRLGSILARTANPLGYVEAEHVLELVQSILALQRDYGDRKTRRHARMKYLIHEMGISK